MHAFCFCSVGFPRPFLGMHGAGRSRPLGSEMRSQIHPMERLWLGRFNVLALGKEFVNFHVETGAGKTSNKLLSQAFSRYHKHFGIAIRDSPFSCLPVSHLVQEAGFFPRPSLLENLMISIRLDVQRGCRGEKGSVTLGGPATGRHCHLIILVKQSMVIFSGTRLHLPLLDCSSAVPLHAPRCAILKGVGCGMVCLVFESQHNRSRGSRFCRFLSFPGFFLESIADWIPLRGI